MVRLVFRPYTQVWQTICTSVLLRASTGVSSGFALLRHSSPSFGSQHVCSHSNLSQKIMVGRCCSVGLPAPRGFDTHRLAHMLDSLVRVSRRVNANLSANVESSVKLVVISHKPNPRWPAPGACIATALGAPAGLNRFPLNNFRYFLTLFSKVFSSFPHGTCSLSVSRQYLALDGIYHLLRAAFPNNPTPRLRLVMPLKPSSTGFSPSLTPFSKGLEAGSWQRTRL